MTGRRWAAVAGAVVLIVAAGLLISRLSGGARTVRAPAVGEALAQWVDGEPVWVVAGEDGAVTVLDAANPQPWKGVTELVGWCERARQFEAYWDGSTFTADGQHRSGRAPRQLATYEVLDVAGSTVSVGARIEGRKRTAGSPPEQSQGEGQASQPAGPRCLVGGNAANAPPATYHDVEGSGRELLEGNLVFPPNGQPQLCRALMTEDPPTCHDGLPAVLPRGPRPDPATSVQGRFLARRDGDRFLDVILLPDGEATRAAP